MTEKNAYERCWAEIDLDALSKNYKTALGLLSPGAKLVCVLKANAYGLGARRVSKTLYDEGARFFAVACVSEALEIKLQLPDADVLVLGRAFGEDAETAVKNDLLLTVYSKDCANEVLRAAQALGMPARVHIKADTGLHRLGFVKNDTELIIDFVKQPLIKLEGLYTHLALRDRENDKKQFEALEYMYGALKNAGLTDFILHACDSIGMVRYPEKHYGAVRTGAWLYGVCPYRYEHPENCLSTVTFKTRISQIHEVAAGECIGYDEEHPLEKDSRVATLSAGYVDGFPRLNNTGFVLIHGKKAAVLGLVCMDQMMVDVSDIKEAKEGDEVILLGGALTVDEYAKTAGLNRNEALCRLGRRVPRVYKLDGRTETALC